MIGPPRSSLVAAGSAFLTVAFALSASAAAQGLGAVAAKEKDRREQTKEAPAKVFTNEDLPERADGSSVGDAESDDVGGESTSSSTVAEPEPADPTREQRDREREELDRGREERAAAEREWRARFAEARIRVREAEARCWQEVVRTEFHKGIPVQMLVKEFVETEEYRQTKKDLTDLQEEFRRTGLPPGWARE